MDSKGVALFSLVALFWGGTNPLIEESVHSDKDYNIQDYSPNSMVSVASSRLFMGAFAINQAGSVLYALLLSSYGEQYTNITANALTTLTTFISETMWKKKALQLQKVCGILLVTLGVYLVLT